ncbi:cytidylate kinase [Chytriomyces cf. hyalinus JEL632]|nr:cytidylate kinase [Chytriomyces cf. hyalinus JEL632]
MTLKRAFQIAIDGVASTGKSQTARLLVQRLDGFAHIDSGAMYRAITLKTFPLKPAVPSTAWAEQVAAIADNTQFHFAGSRLFMDGEDVSSDIRSLEVTRAVSAVAAVPAVRSALVRMQRDFASAPGRGSRGVVMEGRDIGSTVLPDAQLKIYLDGQVLVRAERRFAEMHAAAKKASVPLNATLEEIMADVQRRDKADFDRKTSPLKKADRAVVIDTSFLSLTEQVGMLEVLARERLKHWEK